MKEIKTIALGSDHAGFNYKIKIIEMLESKGYAVKDFGQYYVEEPIENLYETPEKVALSVAKGEMDRGILICGSGVAMCVIANKIPGCIAANCYNLYGAIKSREHNDSNILTLGARFIGLELAKEIVDTWLNTDFGEGRHLARKKLVINIDNKYRKI